MGENSLAGPFPDFYVNSQDSGRMVFFGGKGTFNVQSMLPSRSLVERVRLNHKQCCTLQINQKERKLSLPEFLI